jgi:hypothetical protein
VAEDELTTTMDRHAELFSGGPDVHALSTKIVEQARQITHLVPVQSSVPAACFLVHSAKYKSLETVSFPCQFILLIGLLFPTSFAPIETYTCFQVYCGGGQVDV